VCVGAVKARDISLIMPGAEIIPNLRMLLTSESERCSGITPNRWECSGSPVRRVRLAGCGNPRKASRQSFLLPPILMPPSLMKRDRSQESKLLATTARF